MYVKFRLSVSESSRDIKGIVLPAGSVHLQAREWQFDQHSASQRQFPLLPPTAAIRYCLSMTVGFMSFMTKSPAGSLLVHYCTLYGNATHIANGMSSMSRNRDQLRA